MPPSPHRRRSSALLSIDVGGTFTDCLLIVPDAPPRSFKLLSSGLFTGTVAAGSTRGRVVDPLRRGGPPDFFAGWTLCIEHADVPATERRRVRRCDPATGTLTLASPLRRAPAAGARYTLDCGLPAPAIGACWLLGVNPLHAPTSLRIRLGTTRATNALLERKLPKTALLTTEGFADVLIIGDQSRPRLFDLHIEKPRPLTDSVFEITERLDAAGRIVQPLDRRTLHRALAAAREAGCTAVAISFVHAHRNDAHERTAARAARRAGFTTVCTGSALAAREGFLDRTQTAVAEACLAPIVRDYTRTLHAALPRCRIGLMTSAGGLVDARDVRAHETILSGPAGGVVGAAHVARRCGLGRIISFDAGGTSTDVARWDGGFELRDEIRLSDRRTTLRLAGSMIEIETVAAGGGSVCDFDGVRLTVGPDSAGAEPGPACYGRGGPLTVTDVHLLLGRLPADRFPFALDRRAAARRLDNLRQRLRRRGQRLTARQIATGLLRIATTRMARAIRRITTQRGVDPRTHALVAFGGAGGLHACMLADELGITTVVCPAAAGVLSAWGIATADLTRRQRIHVGRPLSRAAVGAVCEQLDRAAGPLRRALRREGVDPASIEARRILHLRYRGQDHTLRIAEPPGGQWRRAFEATHQQRFGFVHARRPIEIHAAEIELRAKTTASRATMEAGRAKMGASRAKMGASRPRLADECRMSSEECRKRAGHGSSTTWIPRPCKPPRPPRAYRPLPSGAGRRPTLREGDACAPRRFPALCALRPGPCALRRSVGSPDAVRDERPPRDACSLFPDPCSLRRHSPRRLVPCVFNDRRERIGLWWTEDLPPGACIAGPALIADATFSVVVEPGWTLHVLETADLLLQRNEHEHTQPPDGASDGGQPPPAGIAKRIDREQPPPAGHRSTSRTRARRRPVPCPSFPLVSHPQTAARASRTADPVQIELFHNHFAGIAEQMGATLQRAALSTNIKQRLDFSCALYDAAGRLVANAPHIPVHLGAMGSVVRHLIRDARRGRVRLRPDRAFVTNDPYRGGSHLPDVTVILPVFLDRDRPQFFLASRAHHAEIGGLAPGSMPAASRRLVEEGVVIPPVVLRLKSAGSGLLELDERPLRRVLTSGPYPSRDPDANLADIRAQIAACLHGRTHLRAMCERFGRATVAASMRHIRDAAARLMRGTIAALPLRDAAFADKLDDGTPIRVRLRRRHDRLWIDFTGTGGVHPGNLNATPAIVRSVVLYVLRCLVPRDLPLNDGLLEPVRLTIPRGLLNPPAYRDLSRRAAVAGGNVETSQLLADCLLAALGVLAAGPGTMNNLTFGTAGWGYYETIGGGSGAGPHFDGADAVHVHMTNTRITDVETLEARYPVRLRRFAVRRGSGGRGRHTGGDGIVREIEFLRPLTVSLLTQRRRRAPFGLAGGRPGQPGRNTLIHPDGTTTDLPPITTCQTRPHDILRIETPAGGGYGRK